MEGIPTVTVSLSRKVKRVLGLSNRLAAYVTSDPNGCLTWTRAKMKNGYAVMTVEGRTRLVHRVAWEHFVEPIPEGMTIDHLCGNRACINVLHMEVVSRGENTLRGNSPPANQRRQTICKNGHDLSESYRYGSRRLCRICRAEAARRLRAKGGRNG